MSTVTDGARLTQSATKFLRANTDIARQLQDHYGEVIKRDAIDATEAQWSRLVTDSIIQHANDHIKYGGAIEWEINPAAEASIEDAASINGPWPDCPHTGIQNLGDGQYSCGDANCEVAYSRKTAEEVTLR